jgi:transcriptional regulator with XRE-family HTH domain
MLWGEFPAVWLASVLMTGIDEVRMNRRRAHWLRIAREAANIKQTDAARALGYKAGTSILAMEKARKVPDAIEQQKLAALYGVPVSMFADPAPTDEERVAEARAELARAAIELAAEDRKAEAATRQRGAGQPASPPRRRSA